MIKFENIVFAKAFKAEEGTSLAAAIVETAGDIAGRRVVIIDHPPTAGLKPLIEGLEDAGAEVFLRDHHADADRDGTTVARVREILGDRAVVLTRAEHPACSTLINMGEFSDDIVIADADMDGVTAALKAIGVSYPELDLDAAVLDGPAAQQTEERLSSLGWAFRRAWGGLPPFGDRSLDAVMIEVITALADAIRGEASGIATLERFAFEYEEKVVASKELATTAAEPFVGFRLLNVPAEARFDGPTLASALDEGMLVSGRVVSTGPIAGKPGGFGRQVSLARTKKGEAAGLDLAALAEEAFGPRPEARWGPVDGVISNTPFLLHLSPERWEVFRPVLEVALRDAQ